MQCTGIQPGFLGKLTGNGVALPGNFFQTDSGAPSGGYTAAFGRRAS